MGEQPGLDVAVCLARVRERDEDAARALVEHLYPLVIKIVRAHLPRALDEEDLSQEIFMKLFANAAQYRGEVPFAHWVSRIAVSTCIDRLRAQKRRPEWRWADLSEREADVLDAVLHTEHEPDTALAIDAGELVGKLMQTLNAEDQLVIRLLDLEERTVAEIAAQTGWSQTLVKVRAFRARRKLRKQLEQLEKQKRHE
jgi:RNA polymerase sigma factor (sigma-70 family)